MFLGHFGVGFASKAAARKTSLGTLFLAAQFVDLLWPTLLLLGVERVAIQPGITKVTPLDFTFYPYSHSLLAAVAWGLLIGGMYWLIKRYPRGAWVVGALVVSHWVLDLLVHRPDLPLLPNGPMVGLDLWRSLPATLVLEAGVFFGGLYLYLSRTVAKDRTGAIALWALVAFLALVDAGPVFGPAPTSVTAVAWAGQAQWLLVLWGYWVDAHREVRASRGNQSAAA